MACDSPASCRLLSVPLVLSEVEKSAVRKDDKLFFQNTLGNNAREYIFPDAPQVSGPLALPPPPCPPVPAPKLRNTCLVQYKYLEEEPRLPKKGTTFSFPGEQMGTMSVGLVSMLSFLR